MSLMSLHNQQTNYQLARRMAASTRCRFRFSTLRTKCWEGKDRHPSEINARFEAAPESGIFATQKKAAPLDMQIVLGNSTLATYQQGGGHWTRFLQYPLGLKALGHEVFWLELLRSSGRREHDLRLIHGFFDRLAFHNLDRDCAVLLFNSHLDFQPIEKQRGIRKKRRRGPENNSKC